MTKILMLYEQGAIVGFEVKGHSGAGTRGNDLVCAAVSFLATTCANALEDVAKTAPLLQQSDAYLKARLSKEQLNPAAITILETFHRGAKDLLEAYPEHVSLNDKLI